MTRCQRWAIISTTVFPLIGMLVWYETWDVRYWLAFHEAKLQVNSQRSVPVKQVAWGTSVRKEDLLKAVECYSSGVTGPCWDFHDPPAKLPADGIVVISLKFCGTSSPFGIYKNSRGGERFAIVQIEYEDGLTLYRVVELDSENPDTITQLVIPADATK